MEKYTSYIMRLTLRIMKFSFYILMVILSATQILCAVETKGQMLDRTIMDIREENKSLKQLLTLIETKSKIRFTYNENLIRPFDNIAVDEKSTTVSTILKHILAQTNLDFIEKNNRVIIIEKNAQSITNTSSTLTVVIKGTVTDENGKVMPGVNVMLKGSSIGVATNVKGEYSLTLPDATGILVFSFISYETKEIPLEGSTVINAKMDPATGSLKEVVVVGYGTQAKSKVSGAITTVNAKDVALSPSSNLGSGLAGRIAGVTINDRGGEPGNSGVEIFIRGRSTTGDASPLYVIDGIVRDYNALSYLPPNEIESISVLKDASAAIYGSRAANGVILVTTKRGKTGKAVITATYNQAITQQSRVPESADAFTFATMANLSQRIKGLPEPYSANDLQLYQDGTDPLNHPNTDWQSLIFKKWSAQARADVSVSGGNENVKYFIAAGYLDNESPFKSSFTNNKEYHFRSNIDAQINKDLKISLDISGRKRKNLSSRFDWAHVYLGLPVANGIYPNGLYGSGRSGYSALLMARDPDYGYINANAGNILSTLSAEYKIPGVEGLSVQGNLAYDYDNNYIKTYSGVTFYHVYDPATKQYNKIQSANTALPSLNVDYPNSNSLTSNIKLAYKKVIAQDHTLDAFIAFEQNTTEAYTLSGGRTNFASGSIQELFAGDANKVNQSNTGFSAATGRQNLFGRALYSFGDKYNVQFQFRYDGSQNFPVGKRYGFFPGISGNWNISKENFMKEAKWLDYMKIRASWGELGNDKIGPYQYLTSYTYGNNYAFNGGTNQGLSQTNAPNPNITWEVAKTTDIGLEASIFNGLVTAELDFFRTYRSNILYPRNASVPAYSGLSLPAENIGRTKNQGFEFSLSTAGKVASDFRYNVGGNFTYAKNTVLFMDEVPGLPEWQKGEGKSLNSAVLYESVGIYKSQADIDALPHLASNVPGDLIFRDVNKDGIINTLDQVRQRFSSTPEIVYGINFQVGYKHFDLALGFQGQGNVLAQKYIFIPFDPLGWGNFASAQANNVWSPENPNGTNPAPGQSFDRYSNSTFRHTSGAFLRLKTAELSYSFANQLLDKAGFKNARVYLSGSNLFYIHDNFRDVNIDPEQTNVGWGYGQQRVINLGLSLTL